jgi:LuxR family maltose regulon positive regulatory protein
LYNSGLHVFLYRARSRYDLTSLRSGIVFAGRLIENTFRRQYLPVALEGLLLRAQLHTLLENHPASQADLVRALELAEPEGCIAVFVEQGPPVAEALAALVEQNNLGSVQPDYVRRILAASSSLERPDKTGSGAPPASLPAEMELEPLIEPLTDREMEVLHLMAQGLKYREIAAELFISLNTVRSHVKAIYGKLNVNNRTHAIAAARQRRIL